MTVHESGKIKISDAVAMAFWVWPATPDSTARINFVIYHYHAQKDFLGLPSFAPDEVRQMGKRLIEAADCA